MYNEVIFKQLVSKFGIEKVTTFAEVFAEYNKQAQDVGLEACEREFESEWWGLKYEKLKEKQLIHDRY